MRETLYFRVSKMRVEGMTKNMPELRRGEIPVKVVLEVKESAFREPVIEREIIIDDWRDDIDISDLSLEMKTITEHEAGLVREARLKRMEAIMVKNGYEVSKGKYFQPPMSLRHYDKNEQPIGLPYRLASIGYGDNGADFNYIGDNGSNKSTLTISADGKEDFMARLDALKLVAVAS